MTDSSPPRLGAAHLDDLAIIILTTALGSEATNSRPELDQDARSRLRTRLKLVSRHDWPSNMGEDPAIRRGYTLRQCFRLMTALLLLDAHISPSMAVPIARSNELLFLRIIASRLANPDKGESPDDKIAVILLSEFWEWLNPCEWKQAVPHRVRVLTRSELSHLWSNELSLGTPGQRLVIDIGGVARMTWRWIRARSVLPEQALVDLLREIDRMNAEPDFQPVVARSRRR